ncbi:MAG: TRAP transporter small permease [Chloroflexota bacterium]|nr:TRAP transporter small permease [Chloroflexota bacterium]
MSRLIRIIETISDVASGHFTGWVVVVMMLLVMVEVVTRYVLQQALAISDEYSAYMLVAISFMGLAYVSRQKSQIRIEVVTSKLRPKVKKWLRLVTLAIGVAFFIILTRASYDLVMYSISHGARSGSWLRTPLVGPQLFMFIGGILICLQIIVEFIYAVRALKAPGEAT